MMKLNQLPHTLLMIRPAAFGFNPETSASNAFQQMPEENADIHQKAVEEFNRMLQLLEANEIAVRVFDDTESGKPDAIFPNNWISFHEDGTVILYPMLAKNRRKERRRDIIDSLAANFIIKDVVDLSAEEVESRFLEGTGSLVFDHAQRVVYACQSPRTHPALVSLVADKLRYKPIVFDAFDEHGKAVYHTNVVLSVGQKFVLVCLDAIRDEAQQDILLESFSAAGHKVIAISFAQMHAFAGNVLEVQNRYGDPIVIMSQTAFQSFLPGQLNAIGEFAEILPVRIDTIERHGGGSVRCMVAGIHLPT